MRIHLPRLACLAALVALLSAAPAVAGVSDGRSPDTRDAAYLAHLDGRSPVTLDAAAQAHAVAVVADGRSPDTRDAAFAAHALTPALIVSDTGFDWLDAGIGAAGGFAIALVLATGVAVVNRGGRGKLAA